MMHSPLTLNKDIGRVRYNEYTKACRFLEYPVAEAYESGLLCIQAVYVINRNLIKPMTYG